MAPDLVDALRTAPRYVSSAVVEARPVATERAFRSARGSDLVGRSGDWLVTDGTSEWVVAATIFDRAYRELSDGRFAKDAPVRAVQVEQRVQVTTLEGSATAEAGDWVLRGIDGEMWPVTDEFFRNNYTAAQTTGPRRM